MFELSTLSMDKFVHTFYQNLGLKIDTSVCKSSKKIAFVTYIDKVCKVRQQLLYTIEKIKDITMLQRLDFSNEKDVHYFIQKHATLFDKFSSLSNTRILTSHLKNINMKIVQKVKTRRKRTENTKSNEAKVLNKSTACHKAVTRTNLAHKLDGSKQNLSSVTFCKEKNVNAHNYKRGKNRKNNLENSNVFCHEESRFNGQANNNGLKTKNSVKKTFNTQNLSAHMTVKREIEMAEKFLTLCIKDTEFIKRNVHITLHIAKKSNCSNNKTHLSKCNQMLCHHAILCLIEPSKKAFVLMEDNLSVVIEKYLSQGYKYHFEYQRDSKDCFTALLILSHWAKVLIKHNNTTIMHTISGILGCNIRNISVLSTPEMN